MKIEADVAVLGAGIVGVSVAVHLARRGRSVVLVDKRSPGEETSFGNAGLIQREGVLPHAFPRGWTELFRHGLNRTTDSHYHPSALMKVAPFLARYWWNSHPERYRNMVRLYEPLIRHSVSEHQDLIEAAGAEALIGKNGWYRAFRSQKSLDKAYAEAEWVEREFSVHHQKLDGNQLASTEPDLLVRFQGALHWTDPWTVKDPHALTLSYLRYFQQLGGRFVQGDATTLEQNQSSWAVETNEGTLEAREVVLALGPWADRVTTLLGYRLPLGIKRGYHMHYATRDGAKLNNWVLDADRGYFLTPMNRGVRLTTGAEFADRDAKQTPVQLERAEPIARSVFPLGERLDPKPWMGARPATPDMMPIIGPAPRHSKLWFAFGHAHHGLTLGPATGRLLAEIMTGEPTFIDPAPYAPTRFKG